MNPMKLILITGSLKAHSKIKHYITNRDYE